MKPEEEIQKKLKDLEKSLKETELSQGNVSSIKKKNTELSTGDTEKASIGADLQMLGGTALVGVGGLMLLNHIKIGTSYMNLLGFSGGGTGFVLLPIIVGIGIMFYDYKNKLGWLLAGGGIVVLLFVLLSQLTMYFAHISLLGFILMFLPLAVGGALIAKGMKTRRRLDNKAN